MSGDERPRRRTVLLVLLAGATALLLAMLAVATNLATNAVPERLQHLAHDPRITWITTGVLLFIVVGLTVVYQHLSDGRDDSQRELTESLNTLISGQSIDEARGRLFRIQERLAGLPEVVQAEITREFENDSQSIEEIVASATTDTVDPVDSIRVWIDAPPDWLADGSSHRHPSAWAILGEIAAAYGQSALASRAFASAASATGGGRQIYWAARSIWEAILSSDSARAKDLIEAYDSPGEYAEPLMRLVVSLSALLEQNEDVDLARSDQASVETGPVARHALDSNEVNLRATIRAELASWRPIRPVDRDIATRIFAQVEVTDSTRTYADRFTTVMTTLDRSLSEGWIDDTALLIARFLCSRVSVGGSTRKATDLLRAESLAIKVRDRYRTARRDSRPAVQEAVAAAILAGRSRRAIQLGSTQYGDATPHEASDQVVALSVFEAALDYDHTVAQSLLGELSELPNRFVHAWAEARLATREGNDAAERPRNLRLWQAVFDIASTDDERRQALTGMAEVGAENLPQLDELFAGDAWLADQLRARSALCRGDARSAIQLTYSHRHEAAAAAALLADAYVAHGDLDAAVSTLEEAALEFDFDELMIHAAQACVRAGQPDRAEQLIESAIRTGDPAWFGRSQALAFLADLKMRRGDLLGAIESWTSALEDDPEADNVRWELAGAHERRGNHDIAWAVLTGKPGGPEENPPPLDPPNGRAAYLVLLLLFRRNQLVEMVRRGIAYLDSFRGDEVIGRILALLATSTADNTLELPDALERSLHAALSAAADSVSSDEPGPIRVIRGTAEEQVDQMVELMRHPPEHTDNIARCMLEVQRGRAPLGMVAMAAGRSYAQCVVDKVAGVLTAVSDQAEHEASIADALAILGINENATSTVDVSLTGRRLPSVELSMATPIAEVVTDASSLYVRGLLPELDNNLVANIREVVLTDEAFIDLTLANDHFARNSGGSLFLDPRSDQLHFSEASAAVVSRQRETSERMLALGRTCRRYPGAITNIPELDAIDAAGSVAWWSGLKLARNRRATIWSDDVALRVLARGFGIPAFSTFSFVEACVRAGRLPGGALNVAVNAMIRGHVGDFAPNVRLSKLLTIEGGDARGAVLSAISKPAFWSDRSAAQNVYGNLVSDLKVLNPAVIPDLAHVSILGIGRSPIPDDEAMGLAVRVLASAMVTVGISGDVPTLLAGVRAAVAVMIDRSWEDLLPMVANKILDIYEQIVSPVTASEQIQLLVAGCSEDDKATVRRVILSRG